MRKSQKQLMRTLIACGLVVSVAAGGTVAYLTDAKTATNTFTVGKVKIDLEEPGYPGNDSDEVKNIIPNQEIAKDPQIENTGNNDALVFLRVEVPQETFTDEDDGTGEQKKQDLFKLKGISDQWELIRTETIAGTDGKAKTSYVYGYKKVLAKDSTTDKLFQKVQMKNAMESNLSGNAEDIIVTACAIQATDIPDINLTPGNDGMLGRDVLDQVYTIFLNQSGDQTSRPADEGDRNQHGKLGRITYQLDGGTLADGTLKEYGDADYGYAPPAPTKEGYTFTGWSPEKLPADSTGNVTFSAAWKVNTYDNVINQLIFYDTAMKNAASYYGNTVKKSADYGSKFKITESDFSSFQTPNGFARRTTVSSSTDSKLHPLSDEYTQPSSAISFNVAYYPLSYKISYNLDGGTNDAANPTSYDVMHEVHFKNPTKKGYLFNGWQDADGNSVSGINVGAASSFTSASDFFAETGKRVTGNQTFTAQWVPDTNTKYQVIYRQQQDDGTFKVSDTKYYYGTTDQTIDAPRLTYSGFQTPDAQKLTITSDGSATVTYDYYKQFSITYNLDYGTLATGTKTTYLSSDSNYTIPRPTRNAWTFDGWTGSNGDDPTHDVIIKKGSLGNKTYTANWVGETIAVTCENWSVDYNGNLYKKLSTESKQINVESGTEVSGAEWGENTALHTYVVNYAYKKASTLTVSKNHHTVYRYFWIGANASNPAMIKSLTRNGVSTPAYADITMTWKDNKGNIIKQDTYHYPDEENNLISFTKFICEPNYTQNALPDGGFASSANEQSANSYKLFKKTNNGSLTRLYWDYLTDTCTTESYTKVWYWDNEKGNFMYTGPVIQNDSKVTQAYNITKYWQIEYPDGTIIKKDWGINGVYPTGSKITMHFDGDIANKEEPGWIIDDDDLPWYCDSVGNQEFTKLANGASYTLDGNIHVDGCEIHQDAYAIRFNVNGGSGNMANQCISNVGTDAERTLSKNTLTHAGYHFAGWAKKPNATKADFKDGEVMPIDFGSGSTSTENRKYTCKIIDLYAVWEKN